MTDWVAEKRETSNQGLLLALFCVLNLIILNFSTHSEDLKERRGGSPRKEQQRSRGKKRGVKTRPRITAGGGSIHFIHHFIHSTRLSSLFPRFPLFPFLSFPFSLSSPLPFFYFTFPFPHSSLGDSDLFPAPFLFDPFFILPVPDLCILDSFLHTFILSHPLFTLFTSRPWRVLVVRPDLPCTIIGGATVLLQYLFAPLSLAAHLPFPEHHHSFHPSYLLFFSAVQGKSKKQK